jgi:type IV secretory pathway VirB3-like protein
MIHNGGIGMIHSGGTRMIHNRGIGMTLVGIGMVLVGIIIIITGSKIFINLILIIQFPTNNNKDFNSQNMFKRVLNNKTTVNILSRRLNNIKLGKRND